MSEQEEKNDSDPNKVNKRKGGRAKKLTVKFAIEALEVSQGNISLAAKAANCSRTVFHSFINEEEELQRWLVDHREKRIDNAEMSLDVATLEKQPWATLFTLKTIGKKRGYETQEELIIRKGLPELDMSKLTGEELEVLEKILAKARREKPEEIEPPRDGSSGEGI